MAFGVYVHIPYCLQRCTYCDFATYERSKIFPSPQYVDLVLEELSQRAGFFGPRGLDTLYFGGGTPSLLPSSEIIALMRGLEKRGFPLRSGSEVTIEINPATIDRDKLSAYIDAGINRFSVGAQTFDDRLLKMVHREHDSKQTRETLDLLRARDLNFTFDILFALPTQTLAGLKNDLDIALDLGAKHLSPYCLTVPDGHPLAKGRAPEEEQVEMFETLRSRLIGRGYLPYEISNFAQPGYESRHNLLYWTDQEYWGLGLSAHSHHKGSPWGTRFWNVSGINDYRAQIQAGSTFASPEQLPAVQFEALERHQTLTDFSHTSLRLLRGLSLDEVGKRFSPEIARIAEVPLEKLRARGLLSLGNGRYSLTEEGVVLSNLVFREMTFLAADLRDPSH